MIRRSPIVDKIVEREILLNPLIKQVPIFKRSAMSARDNISNGLRHLRNVFCRAGESSENQSESGAALVEFTILMPVLFMILFGIVEFGAMIWMQNDMTNAAREGARKAAVRGGTMTDAANKACGCLKGIGPIFKITASDVCTVPVGATTGAGEVTVKVIVDKSKASLMNTFFSLSNGSLTASTWGGQIGVNVTMRREDSCKVAQATVGPIDCDTSSGTLSCN
jgi:Flp pilus assembly protein TadG